MKTMEAVKKGFAGSKKLLNVVGIFFVFNVIVGLLTLPLASPERAGDPTTLVLSIGASIVFFLIFAFLQGGALGLIKDNIKSGSFDISRFAEYGKSFYVRIILMLLLYLLIAIVTVLVYGLVSSGLLLIADNIVTRTLVALLVTAGTVIIVTLLIYPVYALVAEDKSVMEAFKKGVSAARNNFWATLGLFLVLMIISLVISILIGFAAGLLTVPFPMAVSNVVVTILNAAVQSYIPIVMMVAFMSFYLSLSSGEEISSAGLSEETPTTGFEA